MTPIAFLGSVGTTELLVILGIVILLFGAKKIPDLARGLGEGVRGFRTSLKGEDEDTPSTPDDKSHQGS